MRTWPNHSSYFEIYLCKICEPRAYYNQVRIGNDEIFLAKTIKLLTTDLSDFVTDIGDGPRKTDNSVADGIGWRCEE